MKIRIFVLIIGVYLRHYTFVVFPLDCLLFMRTNYFPICFPLPTPSLLTIILFSPPPIPSPLPHPFHSLTLSLPHFFPSPLPFLPLICLLLSFSLPLALLLSSVSSLSPSLSLSPSHPLIPSLPSFPSLLPCPLFQCWVEVPRDNLS